jgi:hypothetical protein
MTSQRFDTIDQARAFAAEHYPGAESLPALSALLTDTDLALHRPTGTVVQVSDCRDELDRHASVTVFPAKDLTEQPAMYEAISAVIQFARQEGSESWAQAAADEAADLILGALEAELRDRLPNPDRRQGFLHDRLVERMRPLREQLLVLEAIEVRYLRRQLQGLEPDEREKLLATFHLERDEYEDMLVTDHRRFGTLT